MPEVVNDGKLNPAIIITQDEVAAWLRSIADKAGFADRATSAVQAHLDGGVLNGTPQLILMVSNIPNSRT